jgi:hypothetical protein
VPFTTPGVDSQNRCHYATMNLHNISSESSTTHQHRGQTTNNNLRSLGAKMCDSSWRNWKKTGIRNQKLQGLTKAGHFTKWTSATKTTCCSALQGSEGWQDPAHSDHTVASLWTDVVQRGANSLPESTFGATLQTPVEVTMSDPIGSYWEIWPLNIGGTGHN